MVIARPGAAAEVLMPMIARYDVVLVETPESLGEWR